MFAEVRLCKMQDARCSDLGDCAMPNHDDVSLQDKPFNRFNDAFVKYLLNKEEHKGFLIDLLNAIFDDKRPVCIKSQVTDVTLMDREITPNHYNEKIGRLDIRLETASGEMIDLEVQTTKDTDLGDRIVYYVAKMLAGQITKGKAYHQFKPAMLVVISAVTVRNFETYHAAYELRERDDRELLSDKISAHIIEAPKCSKLSAKNKNRLIRWMKYFTNTTPEEVRLLTQEDPIFKRILEAEQMFVGSPEEMRMYEAAERYELDMNSALFRGRTEGRKEGIEEGLKEGKKKAAFSIALNLLRMGMPVAQIKEATNLNDEELADLKTQLA